MTTLQTSFELAPAGTAIPTSGVAGDGDAFSGGTNGTGNTFVSDNSIPAAIADGSFCAKLTTPATATAAHRFWTITTSTPSFRIYLYLPAAPNASWDLLAPIASGTLVCRLRINTNLSVSHTLGATVTDTTTGTLPLNSLVRIEGTWSMSTTAGTFTVDCYSGNSTTPISGLSLSVSGLAMSAATTASFRIGTLSGSAGPTSLTAYTDGWGVSDSGRLGPTTPPATPATATGSITLAGTATGTGAATAAGAVTLAGAAAGRAATTATGTVTLGGTATATGPTSTTATGTVTLGGTGTAKAAATSTGSITLGGTGTGQAVDWNPSTPWNPSDPWPGPDSGSAATTATGSITLGGSGLGSAVAAATGVIVIGGSGTAKAVAVATGAIVLGGTTAGVAAAAATGAVTLGGTAHAVTVNAYNPHTYVFAPLASNGISTAPLLNNGISTAPLASNGASTAPVMTTS